MATTVESQRAPAADDGPVGPSRRSFSQRITHQSDVLLRSAMPVATGLVAIGLLLRFVAHSELWLDEVLSVNIAHLPLRQIPGALRQDGAPPLYYFVLHFWMKPFGESNFAVRSLSGVVSALSLPLAWIAGKRLGGRRVAWAALLLLASSPFAINYATAARMYSMMILWSLLGFLALARALEQPTRPRLAAVAALTALQLYTHYWGLYAVGVTGLWLLIRAKRRRTEASWLTEDDQRASLACFWAMAIGSFAFLPWLPSFVFQAVHTGTPWSNAAGLGDILSVLGQYAGGGPWGVALSLSLFTLVLLGIFGESVDGRQVLLNLSARRKARPIGLVFIGTLGVAVLFGAVAQAAFVGRYTAVVFPLFILLAGLGATVLADRKVFAAVLGWTVACGLIVGIGANLSPRTEAVRVAKVLNSVASTNDLVVYCPDQLGPAVARLLTVKVNQATFPRANRPERIDWTDYHNAVHTVNVEQFAKEMVSLAAGHDLYFAWNPGYPGTEHKCSKLMDWFSTLRSNGQELVHPNPGGFLEYESLVRFPN